MATERILNGYMIDFCDYCPYLNGNKPSKPVGFFFNAGDKDIIASETACPNGGLPGVEKRSDNGFLIPINPDSVVAYCYGCKFLPEGFEKQIV